MSSYYGMFPAKLAHYFIDRYSPAGGLVLDPFSGRGTSVLQARADGRRPLGNDLSPLAYVLSRAKADPPEWNSLMAVLRKLEREYVAGGTGDLDVPAEISMLYHEKTLRQLVYLRSCLLSRPIEDWDKFELMIAGALAGIMHGAWRRDGSSQYLSISMPNTFSMAPAYVERYIRDNGLQKIEQNVFEKLRDKLARLYLDDPAGAAGVVHRQDAAGLMSGEKLPARSVDLIITSPPYLRVVNYAASNWIRLWLLGVDEVARDGGKGRIELDADLDHQHDYLAYREFIRKTFVAAKRVLKPGGMAIFVIGDVADPGRDAVPLASRVWDDIGESTGLHLINTIDDNLPVQNKVSRIWGDTKGQATNRDRILILTTDADIPYVDNGPVNWDEPYRDGGPDEAHERVEASRYR